MNKAAKITSKTLEVLYLAAAVLGLVLTVFAFVAPTALSNWVENGLANESLEIMDNASEVIVNGHLYIPAVRLLTLDMILKALATCMIFRNIYLIFKVSEGKSKWSKGATPFQPDVVRMVREVGIFAIMLSVIDFIFSIIAGLFPLVDQGLFSISIETITLGIAMICMSRFFLYGQKLESEVEGLV